MYSSLDGKKIVLGVSGSIAAYKAADWTRLLRKEGALINVVMTEAGRQFVSPLTFAALSGGKVYSDMFDETVAEKIPHINLARNCDLMLIAPATAQTVAKLAHGSADDLLSTVILATDAKVIVCPAMNSKMFLHPATQANINKLKEYGYIIVEPDTGAMACGEEGPGRLAEWEVVRQSILATLAPQDLQDRSILITAGPTRESLDPVRFLSNRSTGKMGYALAATAKQRGASVILISGPTNLQPPVGVEFIQVTTGDEMYEAVIGRYRQMDIVVKAAAVSDYRPATTESHKIKKGDADLSLPLKPNRDILKELGERKKKEGASPLLVGFAAESRNHLEEGKRKLAEKNLDLIAINDITGKDAGFAADTNRVILLDPDGTEEDLPLLAKEEIANRIWDSVLRIMSGKSHHS